MSDCLIVVDQRNPDSNGLEDIAAAVRELGDIVQVNEDEHVIEATVPCHELPIIAAMTGVTYVRSIFNYFRGQPTRRAA